MTSDQLELTNQLKTARGKSFVRLLKQTYQAIAPELAAKAREKEKLSVNDVADLAIAYNLSLKHCFDFLEEQMVLPTGTYESLMDRGLKPKKIMESRRAIA